MIDASSVHTFTVARFRAMHESGCFVLPNPWDVGTSLYLQHLGFEALATTSAGVAFTHGLPDAVAAISCETMLDHIREVVAATPLPVNADFQNGYADDPDGVAANVTRCIHTGVAGLSIEDSTGSATKPLYDLALAVDRIRAARAAIDASGVPVVLTARCEAFLVGDPDAFGVVIERLVAFAAAGADCLYAPGVRDLQAIDAIVKAVAPKPVNVLVSSPGAGLTVSNLAALGVRRISLGSALARVAWGAFIRAAKEIATEGTFDTLREATPFAELDELMSGRPR